MAYVLEGLAELVRSLGDYWRAAALLEESLAVQRELGDTYGIAYSLRTLARVVQEQGDYDQAMALYKESLMILQEVNDKRAMAECLEGLAAVVRVQGQLERAARLCGAAAALRAAIGTPVPPAEHAAYERDIAATRAALGDTAWAFAWAAGQMMSLEQVMADALADAHPA